MAISGTVIRTLGRELWESSTTMQWSDAIRSLDRFLRYLFTYVLTTDFEARYQITICTSMAYSGDVWSDLHSPEFTIGIKLPRHITFALKGCT